MATSGGEMGPDDLSVKYPHNLVLQIPLPTSRLSSIIRDALCVDKELSSLVKREITVSPEVPELLVITYHAATARLLRVAANGFMESLNLVLNVCEELDEEALDAYQDEDLEDIYK